MLYQAIPILLALAAQGALGGPVTIRDDGVSLFSPTTGKPDVQDVIDYVNSNIANKDDPDFDTFAGTFATVMYAVASQPGRIEQLFKDKGEGTYEFVFYEPVRHEPVTSLVSFSSETSEGESTPNVRDIKGGNDVDAFKDRWWVAAAYTVLKEEHQSYWEKDNQDGPIATGKGTEYSRGLGVFGMNGPGVDFVGLDYAMAHWLLSVLTRRNVAISDYPSASSILPDTTTTTVRDIANHPPSIWVKPRGDGKTVEAAFALDKPQSDGQVKLSRPDAGSRSMTTVQVEETVGTIATAVFYLQDVKEEWDPKTWYSKTSIPSMRDVTGHAT